MDKLTAAQRRFGMLGFHTGGYTSKLPTGDIFAKLENSESQPGRATPFVNLEAVRTRAIDAVEFQLELAKLEVAELHKMCNEKDEQIDALAAEIDRLLEPTKWWRMLGWVIMTGTVLGVIAGVYEVIT